MDTIKKQKRWPWVMVIIAAAVILLIVLLVTQPRDENSQSVNTSLQSYRMTSSVTSTFGGKTTVSSYEMEYAAPNRYHMKKTSGEDLEEMIIIGDEIYSQEPEELGTNVQKAIAISSSRSIPSKENTLEILNSLIDLKELPDENIDGIACLRYWGRIDNESMVEEQKAKLDPASPHYDEILKSLEDQPKIEITVELWIGKDDHLIRQMKQDTQMPSKETGELDTASSVMKYYDFNEPITIELPLDAQGKLLPGWQLVGSPLVNGTSEEKTFSRNVLSSIGGKDKSHQQINFRITITNVSEEVAQNVRVTLSTTATNDESERWRTEIESSTPGPVDLEPGESESYNITWEYDASNTSKEELSRLVDLTTILAKYTTPEGEEAVQLLFPDAPYPSKTPPSD